MTTDVPVSRRALREARTHESRPAAARPVSGWDAAYFLVEMGVYSGVSVAALRRVNGAWSDLSAPGLLAATAAIALMAVVWGLWGAEHAAHRRRGGWGLLLEYGWMVIGVAGWLVAGLPAVGIPLAGAVAALMVRRLYQPV
ncbi:DUF2568 domain-containing protein [Branchiibius sp. NY16-3462-2]|uniref:DUF2568 domain-containing protein n=1 Tax=Branchiibius sp. NY16-3462-2 TaxID=1807500 RepID=UPI000793168E|nr:DUF2568 domain-containing protein [Branchiibius sp. NY16-3462-2]KYH45185.1 hypothetical protein AZH51_15030 [Branchiibius sp. NY16-3462-2]